MEQITNDLKNNCLQQIFDSAVWFNRDKVFDLIRKAAKDIPEKIKREFFKGFSRPDKLSSNELEHLFRKFLKNKSKYDLSYQIIKRSFFTEFFSSTNHLLETALFSTFNSPIGERIKDTIALVSNQSGWPADVVNCIAIINSTSLITYLSEKNQSIFCELNGLQNIKSDFELSLIKDPVNAWRNNFVLQPHSVFFDTTPGKETRSGKWDSIREAIKNRDESNVASVLSGIVDKEDGDLEFLAEASVILILLSIDLNKNELVSFGIKKIEGKILDGRLNHLPQIRLLTTLALGYAFLKNFNSALRTLSNLRGDEFSVEALGFAGSLALRAERNQEAAALFNLAFQLRDSPMTWPLNALIHMDPLLAGPINNLFPEGKVPLSMDIHAGKKITNVISTLHPEWFEMISDMTAFLKKLGQEKEKTKQEEQGKVIEEKVDTGHKLDESETLVKNNFSEELHQLLDYSEEIIKAERKLKEAHEKREWVLVQEIAANLDIMWKITLDEIWKLASNLNLQKPYPETSPLLRLLSGEQDPSVLVSSIQFFNSLYLNIASSSLEK